MKYGNIEVPDFDPVAAVREEWLAKIGDTLIAPAPPSLTCNERTLQTLCEGMLTFCGWRYFHDPDAPEHLDRRGATVYKDNRKAGFPDLIATRPPRLVYFELKTMRGTTTPEQDWWRDDLLTSGADYMLVRPSDWLRFLWTIAPPGVTTIQCGPHDYTRGEDDIKVPEGDQRGLQKRRQRNDGGQ